MRRLSATSRARYWAGQRWAGLTLIAMVLAAAATRILQTRGLEAPVVLCDEFIYANLAKNLADNGHYLFRDVTLHQSLLYPLLLAPAWLARSMGTTYAVAKGITASAMALTAVPVYLWGRRLVRPLHALLAAGLTLLLPAFFFSGILMTEAAFLPAFVLATFALASMLERPTLLRQLAGFVAIALAVSIRAQGIVLLLVVPTAVLLKAILDARAGGTRGELTAWLRRLWPTALVLGGGFLLYVIYKLVVSEAPLASGLGPYQSIAEAHYPVFSTLRWAVKHFAELGLVIGLVPLSALIVLLWLAFGRAPTTAVERAFLAVVPAALFWVLVETGAFAATTTQALFERYTFYLEPLVLLAFVLWLARGLPRPVAGTAVALGVPALLLLSLSLAQVVTPDAVNGVTLSSLYRFSLHLPGGIHELKAAIAAAALLAGFLFAICAKPFARIALPLLLGLYLGAASTSTIDNLRNSAGRAVAGSDPSWVEHAVGRDEPVLYVNTPELGSDASVLLLQTEFWNPNVSRVYSVGASEVCGLPETPTTLDTATGRIAPRVPDGTRYAIVSRRVPFGGNLVALGGSSDWPLALYRVNGSLRVGTTTEGVYGDGWMGAQAQYSVFVSPGRQPGRVVVTLGRAGWGGADVPARVRISMGRPAASGEGLAKVLQVRHWVVHRLAQRSFVFDVPPPPVRVEVQVKPTFSPSEFGLEDTRQLGVQVSFAFKPRTKTIR
jgi:hypothetical protein